MNEISLIDLHLGKPLEHFLFHSSGTVLHRPGDILTTVHLALMRECAIEKLIIAEDETNPETITTTLSSKSVLLDEIPINEPVPVNLFDEKGSSVIKQDAVFTSKQKELLKKNGTLSLVYKRDAMELQSFQSNNYLHLLATDKFECFEALPQDTRLATAGTQTLSEEAADYPSTSESVIPEDRLFTHPAKMVTVSACKEMMQHPMALGLPRFTKEQQPQPATITSGRTRETAMDFNRRYNEWVAAIEISLSHLKSNKETTFESIDAIGCEIIDLFYKDSYYCCNLLNLRHPPTSDHYLSTHAINTAIIATGVGVTLVYPRWVVRELVFGALLHDVGHQQTYRPSLAQQDFTSSEQQKYDNHAVVGMAMLKNMTKIPVSTMLVVAQHHEMLDGSGRIFHAEAGRIHEFAKIVAAVDAFESRCRFMNTSSALATAVAEAQRGKLELRYVKAIATLLSLFPLGTLIRTREGVVCKVIGTNQQNFRKPLLRSLYTMLDEHLFPIDSMKLIDMNRTALIIAEEVNHSALKSDIAAGFVDD